MENKEMGLNEVLEGLKKIIDNKKMAKEPSDTSHLDEAVMALEEFMKTEVDSPDAKPEMGMIPEPKIESPAAVDTDVLTGPMSGLKNFLIKKSQDKV